MSVLIKGMEMPKNCAECPMKPKACVACLRKVRHMDEELWIPLDHRHADCPLIEIPTPHGDLVDRTELIAEYDRQHVGPPGGARKIMEQATAVIEAED